MAEKICESCAGKYDDMLPECPYCGSINYKGAEAQYLNQLENVRENMEDLKEVPLEETKKEFHKQGRFLIKVIVLTAIVLVVLAALYLLMQIDWDPGRDTKADYLWKQEHYPIMDELYENGDYEALREYFAEGKENPTGGWPHSDFYYIYVDITELLELYGWEEEGQELEPFDYAMILYEEWGGLSSFQNNTLDEQELEKLSDYKSLIQEKFDTRWNMSEAEYEELCRQVEENHGWISLDICEVYVEKWLTTRQ